ncbi:hypothetical protein LZ32DRAFT_659430 [Colletotrichum eremochloae]|nr:hypothetical protein LZ32DRAFT_659430 [Colletotrichum eremochloae]
MQKMKSPVLSLSVLIPSTLALHHLPFVCVSSPPIPLEAGTSTVSAVLEDPLNRRCEATIFFADPNFLPISYSFDSECSGSKINSFKLPIGAPNGEAHVSWSIPHSHASMRTNTNNVGDVGCISQSVLTRTTLATVTRSSTTLVETIETLITSTTTEFETAATAPTGRGDTTSPDTTTTTGTATTQAAPGEPPIETSLTTPAATAPTGRGDTTSPDTTTTTGTATTQAAPGEPPIETSLTTPTTPPADATLATTTNANEAGDRSPAGPPPTSPVPTPPSDPLETFTNTASDRTTPLTTTAAFTAAVSTLTIMHTVTASCSADA